VISYEDFIIDLLTTKDVITEHQVEEARLRAGRDMCSVIDSMVRLQYISEEEILMILASEYGMDTFDFNGYEIPATVIASIAPEIARRYKIMPVMKNDGVLIVAIADPTDLETLDSLRYILKMDVDGVLASYKQIMAAIEKHYGTSADSVDQFINDITEGTVDISEIGTTDLTQETEEEIEDNDGPIIRLASLIILEAFRTRASDIHMEPLERRFRIRNRIDGVLVERENPPKYLQKNLISRIKIMSGMDITEHRIPLDGRIQLPVMGRELDLRVSSIPTTNGESIVLRVLDKQSIMLGIPELGFFPDDEAIINRFISLPDGIFLVTGPTGSGKTTSLYSFLNTINKPSHKIITAENPVEYELPGINQVQINEKAGMTFAAALRSMLRQAPNIIMVGEIRDQETGNIAINAALTGHLVFSTLHTNDAPSTIIRLMDMGIKPFLIASSVRAIMAQRLVRRTCKNCAVEIEPDEAILSALELSIDKFEDAVFKRGEGCNDCSAGYKGRIGIYELFLLDEHIKEMIYKESSAMELRNYARKYHDMRTLREDGVRKAACGLTSLEEVLRMTINDDN